MKHPILLLCSLLCFQVALGQRTLHIPPDRMDTITHVFKQRQHLYKDLNIAPIQKDSTEEHLRLTTFGVTIDVWKKQGHDTGTLMIWIKEYVNPKSDGRSRYYAKTTPILPAQAASIFNYNNVMQIDTIADQFYIDNWPRVADPITYSIEHEDAKDYYFRSYTNPDNYSKKVPESVLIADFISSLWFLLDINTQLDKAHKDQPFSSYYSSENHIRTRSGGNAEP
jgi:hypothetical protein